MFTLETAVIASLILFVAAFGIFTWFLHKTMQASKLPGDDDTYGKQLKWMKIWLGLSTVSAVLLAVVSFMGVERWT